MKRDFTKTALYSKLFKGRSNWYFCYLKSEKLAQALEVLAGQNVSEAASSLKDTAAFAAKVTEDVACAAAGEIAEEVLLANLFLMLSTLRLQGSRGHISKENARVLIEEYEVMIEKLVGDNRRLGLTVSPQDLVIPTIAEESLFAPLPSSFSLSRLPNSLKDISKGHSKNKTQKDSESLKGQNRTALILDFVRKSNGVSIKDISKVVQGCSEKTIQRELNTMIEQGVVAREGERRWSTYHPA
ncbi:MAG: hypothetical protein Q8P58_01000 [Candidatus Adlerbacteria bacterium]|nr:hypothetical protein [Candidatus Adlerbacteria bacterium]